MAAVGPPVGPDPGRERPAVCLSNRDGTCPEAWIASLAAIMEAALNVPVAVNKPFRGGHIIRRHAGKIPWIQMELSRVPLLSNSEKRQLILRSLKTWLKRLQC
jgi:N-formylglutamate amidohydrolase